LSAVVSASDAAKIAVVVELQLAVKTTWFGVTTACGVGVCSSWEVDVTQDFVDIVIIDLGDDLSPIFN
jgi:hypothetical protein